MIIRTNLKEGWGWQLRIALENFQPFDALPETVLTEITPELIIKNYAKDTYIFNQGQPSQDYLFLILSGMVQIIVQGGKGSGTVVGIRHPGQFFGETVLLSGKRYPASAKALKDLSCYLLHKDVFEQLLQNHRDFASFFSHILTDRMRDLYEEMVLEQPAEVFGFSSEPFKKRIADVMSSPVVSCSPHMTANEIARIFSQQKISSVVVTGPKGKLMGLVSERDLISKVMALDSNPAVVRALDIMDKNPVTLPADALFYQAILTMLQRQGKYILVTGQGRAIGIVTIGDLTKARAAGSWTVVKNIEAAGNVNELREAIQPVNQVVANLLREKAPANEICEVFAELQDMVTRRLLAIAEEDLSEIGAPPVDYCWLALGAGGRRELNWRQQNALIYCDSPLGLETQVRAYFLQLAEFMVDGLSQCGFTTIAPQLTARDNGGAQTVSAWKLTVRRWINSSDIQFCSFLDCRPVFGQENLVRELREYTMACLRSNPAIFAAMYGKIPAYSLKSNAQDQVASQHIDLAKVCAQFTGCVRVLAVQEGLGETATLSRLNKLEQIQVLTSEDAEYFETAFQSLLLFRLRENLKQLRLGSLPNDSLDPGGLSHRQRSVLRESFKALDRLYTLTGTKVKASSPH